MQAHPFALAALVAPLLAGCLGEGAAGPAGPMDSSLSTGSGPPPAPSWAWNTTQRFDWSVVAIHVDVPDGSECSVRSTETHRLRPMADGINTWHYVTTGTGTARGGVEHTSPAEAHAVGLDTRDAVVLSDAAEDHGTSLTTLEGKTEGGIHAYYVGDLEPAPPELTSETFDWRHSITFSYNCTAPGTVRFELGADPMLLSLSDSSGGVGVYTRVGLGLRVDDHFSTEVVEPNVTVLAGWLRGSHVSVTLTAPSATHTWSTTVTDSGPSPTYSLHDGPGQYTLEITSASAEDVFFVVAILGVLPAPWLLETS